MMRRGCGLSTLAPEANRQPTVTEPLLTIVDMVAYDVGQAHPRSGQNWTKSQRYAGNLTRRF